MSLKKRIALCYKVPRLSAFIDGDIKQIKRINQVLQRLEKYNKDIYILETYNILRSLENIFDMHKLFLVICEMVDIEYHPALGLLIGELDEIDNSNTKIIQKFQRLAEEECDIS